MCFCHRSLNKQHWRLDEFELSHFLSLFRWRFTFIYKCLEQWQSVFRFLLELHVLNWIWKHCFHFNTELVSMENALSFSNHFRIIPSGYKSEIGDCCSLFIAAFFPSIHSINCINWLASRFVGWLAGRLLGIRQFLWSNFVSTAHRFCVNCCL